MTRPASTPQACASDTTGHERSGSPPLRLSERDVAQLITAAESRDCSPNVGATLPAPDRQAHLDGITGPPGSGKSTLVDALVGQVRADGLTVAVLAVDPSSATTGGAVLGDRVRMSRHSDDGGVYIRSVATRGAARGLAAATRDAVRIVESAGYDLVVVETVGIGQVELDIAGLADTTVVLTVPGLGDTMQMNKAGIMEIGDLYVVNMADRPETPRYIRDLKQALAIGRPHTAIPPVCPTVALSDDGIPELWDAISAHSKALADSGELASRRRSHARAEFHGLIERRWLALLDDLLDRLPGSGEVLRDLDEGRTSPTQAVDTLLQEIDLPDTTTHSGSVRDPYPTTIQPAATSAGEGLPNCGSDGRTIEEL